MILSQHVDLGTATQVLAERPEHLGYLLKARVTDLEDFTATLARVAAGGTALDPEVVSRLLAGDAMTRRLRRSQRVIARCFSSSPRGARTRASPSGWLTERAVQKHVTSIFAKLALPADTDDNRRVLAVLAYLPRPPAPEPSGR